MHPRVAAVLDASSIEYSIRRHSDHPHAIRGPSDFASALGVEPERITKSLLVRCQRKRQYAVVVCSANQRIDFPKVAGHLACARVEVASEADLAKLLGYPRHAVSPIGTHPVPVVMDDGLLAFRTILVGGGHVGVELEVAPLALKAIANAVVVHVRS